MVDDADVNSASVCWSRPQHFCHLGLELLQSSTCHPPLLVSEHGVSVVWKSTLGDEEKRINFGSVAASSAFRN